MTATKDDKKEKKPKGPPTLDEVRAKIRKRYERPTLVYEEDTDLAPIYPTRFLRLNQLLGGGVRAGAIIELFGFEDAGKSSLTQAIAADIQALAPPTKRHVALNNYELRFSYPWARTLGLDTSAAAFTHLRPKSLEEGMGDLHEIACTGRLCCGVIDSVYAANAKARKEMIKQWSTGEGKGTALGVEAVRWGEAWTNLKGTFVDNDVVILAVNQMRELINTGGAPKKGFHSKPVTTPRGHALKFYASVRLRIEGHPLVNKDGEMRHDVDGKRVRIKVIKNSTSDDERGMVEYDLIRGVGFDLVSDLVDLSLQAGTITAGGGGFFKLKSVTIRGRDKLNQLVTDNAKVRAYLEQQVKKYLAEADPDRPKYEAPVDPAEEESGDGPTEE